MSEPSSVKNSTLKREALKALGVLGVLIVIMLWLSGAFIHKVEPAPPAAGPRPERLTTQKVERRTYPVVIEQVGSLRAQTEAQVSSRIMAQVNEIPVSEGDKVTGSSENGSATVLARLDDRDIQARLRQAQSLVVAAERAVQGARARVEAARAQVESAKANRDKAAADYRRTQDLHRNQAATGQQLEHARAQNNVAEAQVLAASQEVQAAQSEIARAQAQGEQAEAAVAEARAMLDYTVIRAPFTGRVVRKMVNVGDMAAPGQPLFFLETPMRPELHASLAESLVPFVKIGQELNVHIDALDRDFRGTVREIAPQSDPGTRTVLVRVGMPSDPGLVNGLFGRMGVPFGETDTLVVPAAAVRNVGQLHLVDALNAEGVPQRRFVTLGQRRGDWVEVLSGLDAGEEVIVP